MKTWGPSIFGAAVVTAALLVFSIVTNVVVEVVGDPIDGTEEHGDNEGEEEGFGVIYVS